MDNAHGCAAELVPGPVKPDRTSTIWWDCTQRGCHARRGLVDWKPLNNVLPGKLAFSDIDGVCQRRDSILLVEWKLPHDSLRVAQKILLEAFSKNHPRQLGLVVYGEVTGPSVDAIQWVYRGRTRAKQDCTLEGLVDIVRRWYAWADNSQ